MSEFDERLCGIRGDFGVIDPRLRVLIRVWRCLGCNSWKLLLLGASLLGVYRFWDFIYVVTFLWVIGIDFVATIGVGFI